MRPPKPFPRGTILGLERLLRRAKSVADVVRIQAVLMRASSGLPPGEIAMVTGLSLHTVRTLHSQVLREGLSVLAARPGRGGRRRSCLTREQEERVLRSMESKAALGQVLVVQSIQLAIEQEVGHKVGRSSVYRLLYRRGWRKVSPRARNPGHAAEAFKELRSRWRGWQRLQGHQGLVPLLMFQDEGRFCRISELRKCWAPPGMRPTVPRQVVRESVSAFVAITPSSGRMVFRIAQQTNSHAMSAFLAEVARRFPRHGILMVLDGAG